MPSRHHAWMEYIKTVSIIGAGLLGLGTIWNYAKPIAESGPLPVPSRAEVQAVAAQEVQAHMKFLDQQDQISNRLDELGIAQRRFGIWQQSQVAASQAGSLRNLQAGVEVAKARYAQSKSIDDERVLETLQMQLDALQEQVKRGIVP